MLIGCSVAAAAAAVSSSGLPYFVIFAVDLVFGSRRSCFDFKHKKETTEHGMESMRNSMMLNIVGLLSESFH